LELVLGSVLWNGNLNDYKVNTDLNTWSFSNPVGEYQTYIFGNANPAAKMSDYVQLSPNFKNPADGVSNQGMQIQINPNSHWNGDQNLERTELIANMNDQTIETGVIIYKWSMMQDPNNPLLVANEHQLVFFEAHFADIKFGGQGGNALTWWPNSQMAWSGPFTPGTWYNFGLQIDYTNNMASLYYSQNGDALKVVAGPTAVTTAVSDFHVGNLRVAANGGQTANTEFIYYSGVQIVNSPNDLVLTGGSGGAGGGAGGAGGANALSPGAAFGVFLLVFVVVVVGSFFAIVVFLKFKRPETYNNFKLKVAEKLGRK